MARCENNTCNFQLKSVNQYGIRQFECTKCGRRTYGHTDEPSLVQKVVNVTKAIKQHIKCGRPKATQEQMDVRFKICQDCFYFKDLGEGGTCTHDQCGCGISKSPAKLLNKLSFADSKCPIDKWGRLDVTQCCKNTT
jgi:hypothetical protein